MFRQTPDIRSTPFGARIPVALPGSGGPDGTGV
jgi:hypothetical protein